MRSNGLGIFSRALSWLFIAALINFAFRFWSYPALSVLSPGTVLPEVSRGAPVQGITSQPDFNFSFGGREYGVRPKASYELYGVVVSHNDPTGWGDIYHDENSVDFRDICVVWGDNALSLGAGFEFYSEPWTCFVRFNSPEAADAFSGLELSNNHLLGGSDATRKLINGLRIGDQVYISGLLVDYWDKEYPDLIRTSSLRRDDTGNGACEVFFVEDAAVLKRYEPTRYNAYDTAKSVLLIMLLVKLVSVPLLAYLEYRSI